MHNAIRHTPNRGTMVLRFRGDDGGVHIEVEADGPGIPQDELGKVFDRFYRVEHGRSREPGGAGLGLSIARWGIELHGGSIVAKTRSRGGSVFQILLPGTVRPALDSSQELADRANLAPPARDPRNPAWVIASAA